MKNDDLISVIIPAYNCQKSIIECLKSIIEQSYKELEVIIIDDGSKDNTFSLCKKISEEDNRVRVIKNNYNMGVSATRNIGLKNSKGKYIIFVDSDDKVLEGYLETLHNNIKKSELSVCGYAREENESKNHICNKIQLTQDEGYYYLISNDQFGGYIWNKLYINAIIKENNIEFDEKIAVCEDFLFNSQYLKFCSTICFENEKLYYYKKNIYSATYDSSKFYLKRLSIIEAYEKIIDNYKATSIINLDYVLYSYMKVLLHTKYITKKNKIYFDDRNLLECWKIIKKSKKIGRMKKIILQVRMKFPYLTEKIKYVILRRKG